MISRTSLRLAAATALVSAGLLATSAQAAPMVTYSWTTTSEGYGLALGEPTSATFQVPLSDVLAGVIPQLDITNIQLTYPGLTFNSADSSGDGFDFAAYVNPLTGAFIYHDAQQGLGVIAFAGTDINDAITYLSITIDNAVGTTVADEFNALNNGNADAGYPTAGYWTATFPSVPPPPTVPEPSGLALLGLGLLGLGAVRRSVRI